MKANSKDQENLGNPDQLLQKLNSDNLNQLMIKPNFIPTFH